MIDNRPNQQYGKDTVTSITASGGGSSRHNLLQYERGRGQPSHHIPPSRGGLPPKGERTHRTHFAHMNAYQSALQKQQATQYKEQQVRTASKEQLLIMLYDGAIRFTKIAKKAMESGDLQTSNEHLIKAQRIVTEFMVSLDQDTGGDASKGLFQLYEYLHYRLVQANIKKDPDMIVEVTDHLRGLRDTWQQAINIAIQEKRLSGEKITANEA